MTSCTLYLAIFIFYTYSQFFFVAGQGFTLTPAYFHRFLFTGDITNSFFGDRPLNKYFNPLFLLSI